MITLYLRASDRDALIEALPFLAFGDDGVACYTEAYALDLIGPIVITDAVMDEDGETVLTPAVTDDRFHANLRLLDESLADQVAGEVIVTPTSPARVFA